MPPSNFSITILYENSANPDNPELEPGHGFAAYIEYGEKRILFDTGWNGNRLIRNIDRLKIPIETIDALVISHAHWDHMGGLANVLERLNEKGATKPLHTYVPFGYSEAQPSEMKKIHSPVIFHSSIEPYTLSEVSEDIHSSGTLKNKVQPEQILYLELPTENPEDHPLLFLVGCLHPGLKQPMSIASQFGIVKGIMGGVHGFDDEAYLNSCIQNGLEFVQIGHCTKHPELFQQNPNLVTMPLYVGKKYDF